MVCVWMTRGQMRLLELAGAPYQTTAKFQTRLFLLAEKLSGDLGSIPLSTGQFDTEGHNVTIHGDNLAPKSGIEKSFL